MGSRPTFTPQELAQLADRTLEHYREHAEDFRQGTHDHDVSQNIAALLQHIVGPPPFTILDLGCGPGRDLATFTQLGHRAIGLDGAAPFVAMARAATGCEVWEQDFLTLDLPDNHFHGIFANAALFQVPAQELPRVLRELRAALKPDGVLFSSNPRGNDEEGWSGGRFGVYYRLETWQRYVTAAGFAELAHYYRPAGLPRAQQPWLATVWRKEGDARAANNHASARSP
jgi:SAM-dependent methyltransferase